MADKELSRHPLETEVYLGGKPAKDIDWLTITRTTGGRGDRATFWRKDPAILVDPGDGIMPTTEEIEIRIKGTTPAQGLAVGGAAAAAAGAKKAKVLFWGVIVGHSFSISSNERIEFEAGIPAFLYGDPLRGMLEHNPFGIGAETWNNTVGHGNERGSNSLVFNPYHHNRVVGNMDPSRHHGDGQIRLFVDDNSLRSETAREKRNFKWVKDEDFKKHADDMFWTLTEAVLHLCWVLNPKEKYIKNPTRKQLETELPIDVEGGGESLGSRIDPTTGMETVGTEMLRNVHIPFGTYLPDALDMLLRPLGYSWCLDFEQGKRTFRFWKRGEGDEQEVALQKPGEFLDPNKSESPEINVEIGTASLANQFRGIGAPHLIEGTWLLGKAWDDDDDPALGDYSDYAKDASKYKEAEKYKRVLRDYVINEAADYADLVNDDPSPLREMYRVLQRHRPEGVKANQTARRRRFYPCLTLGADGAPIGENGYVIEFDASKLLTDGEEAGGEENWQPIANCPYTVGSIVILHEECGVRFDGHNPPEAELTLRITCCIQDDYRLEKVAERKDTSPQKEIVEQLLVDPRRFQYCKVDEDSIHAAKVKSGELRAEERDDGDALQRMVDRMRDAWDHADIRGTVRLHGLDCTPYKLGDLVTGCPGRQVDFNARKGSGKKTYPQVVAIAMDNQRQSVVLSIETQRG